MAQLIMTYIERTMYSVYYTDARTTSESQKIILSMKFELNLFAGSRNDLEKICILCIPI